MTVWLVRAGRDGLRERAALEQGAVFIGFDEVGDVSAFDTKPELFEALLRASGHGENTVANHANQVWSFAKKIQIGDIVALPLKRSPEVALGVVEGPYEYDVSADLETRHRRRVRWVRPDTPRSAFGQDLLYSLGAFLTVCRIQRNDADKRIAAIMDGRPDPGSGERLSTGALRPAEEDASSDDAEAVDLARYGRDRIASHISRVFAGHRLTDLIDAILVAEGFHTFVSPPGPDGGVDILAGSGPLGFDEPRLCVQVKTGEADAPMLRDLQGTMRNVGASQGLFVAWAGFKKTARDEERRTFFDVRLWDSDDVIERLTAVYDRLPAAIRDELPLTQVWTLVEVEE